MTAVWKPGQWVTSGIGKPAISWWRNGVAAKGEASTVTQIRIYGSEAERFDAIAKADLPWVMNRRPFQIDEDGFKINGVFYPGILIDDALSEKLRSEATTVTNERFENVLRESEANFGQVWQEKYELLIERFIELIVKSACRQEVTS